MNDWIELDRSALRENVEALSALLPPGCQLMPAVKANAYGHGAVPITLELERLGIRAFFVATAEEDAKLRRHGIAGDILILRYTPPERFRLIHEYDLIQTVVDASYAALLDASSQRYRVHLKLDTGMHRLGERCEQLDRIAAVFLCRNLSIEGVYTHLCAADADSPQSAAFTQAQGKAFYDTIAALERRGCSCGKTHLLASSGLLRYPELGGAYARVGIALYGVLGRSGAESISAYDVAEQSESITNEVLSRLGDRLERILL